MKTFRLLLLFCALFSAFVVRADSVPSGKTLTLSVGANGTEPFYYKWYKDGAVIPNETGTTLVIPNFTAANNGIYSCIVTNKLGSTESNKLQLTAVIPESAPGNVVITILP